MSLHTYTAVFISLVNCEYHVDCHESPFFCLLQDLLDEPAAVYHQSYPDQ